MGIASAAYVSALSSGKKPIFCKIRYDLGTRSIINNAYFIASILQPHGTGRKLFISTDWLWKSGRSGAVSETLGILAKLTDTCDSHDRAEANAMKTILLFTSPSRRSKVIGRSIIKSLLKTPTGSSFG